MKPSTLAVVYFRQQVENALPDLQLDPTVVAALLQRVKGKRPQISQHVPKAAAQTVIPVQKSTTPSSKAKSATGSSRLASLRHVDLLMRSSSQVKRAVEAQPPDIPSASGGAPTALDKRALLKELYVAGCTQCQLSQSRKSFVFGAGSAEAAVMVIGEAPGRKEDEQGLPFVGAAGNLLTSMLAAIKLDRQKDIFITNILKCRPPGNRNPDTAEIVTCLPLLRAQIAAIQPRALLLLGRIAAHAVLETQQPLAQLRSIVHEYKGIPTMVIYHPAALLRNAAYKRPAWEDLQHFQQVLNKLGIYGSL